jgi:hypothetical protein
MAEHGSKPTSADRDDCPASILLRSIRAEEDSRSLAASLAATADDIASTLDRVAETREARANQARGDRCDSTRQAAQRARDKADRERRDARELREKWNLPRD